MKVVAAVGAGMARVTFMWANHRVNAIQPFVWYDVLCLVREDAAVGNRDGGRERDGRADRDRGAVRVTLITICYTVLTRMHVRMSDFDPLDELLKALPRYAIAFGLCISTDSTVSPPPPSHLHLDIVSWLSSRLPLKAKMTADAITPASSPLPRAVSLPYHGLSLSHEDCHD
jgi:hypothetical protein